MRKWISLLGVIVVVAAAVVIYTHYHKKNSSTATTTTSAAAVPIAPLTGLPDPGGAALTRPALTVKIENTPEALPQWGIDQADVVYEEIVNGGITRLAAIFNSQAPAKIGPVRSVRPTDTQVVFPLKGIFAYSGGAPYAITSIETVPGLTLVDEDRADETSAMYRDPNLYPPHNLFGIGSALFAIGGSPAPPPALFSYRGAGEKVKGTTVASFVVNFPSIYPVTWTWDATTGSWDRTLFGKADVTGTGARESPKNVVVMFVNYVNGIGTLNSYANLQGSGTADFFTDGKEFAGMWSRGASMSDVIQYQTSSGKTAKLTPGQTWVELLDVGAALTVTP
jgi:uncharacterized membrane protein YfcA